jgi:hypothetical protein
VPLISRLETKVAPGSSHWDRCDGIDLPVKRTVPTSLIEAGQAAEAFAQVG